MVKIPDDLAARMAKGEVVLFAGAGLSAPAGLPGWRGLLEHALKRAAGENVLRPGDEDSIRDLIDRDKLLLAAEELRECLGEPGFWRAMREIFQVGLVLPKRLSGPAQNAVGAPRRRSLQPSHQYRHRDLRKD